MSEYYGNNDWRDYLALKHHGILGQKWGKQNGPPYPLGYGDHSSAEKKANPKGRLDNYEPSSLGRKRRYITKESKRIEKRYAKDIKRLERVSNRASKRYERSAENGPSRRTDRLEERYRDALTDAEALKRMRDTELERLNNMTEREIKAEKKEARDKLRDLEYESDSFFGRLKEKREYKKELADERGRERLTSGERNQIKEQVGKEVDSKHNQLSKEVKKSDGREYDDQHNSDLAVDAYEKALKGKKLSEAEHNALVEEVARKINVNKAIKYFDTNKNDDLDALKEDIRQTIGDLDYKYSYGEKNFFGRRSVGRGTAEDLAIQISSKVGKDQQKYHALSKSRIDGAIERAKKSDSWDIEFLEAIQNSDMLAKGNTSQMLKEYKKYLEDPSDYRKNRAHKLKEWDGD